MSEERKKKEMMISISNNSFLLKNGVRVELFLGKTTTLWPRAQRTPKCFLKPKKKLLIL
jgi:hypothetical protein